MKAPPAIDFDAPPCPPDGANIEDYYVYLYYHTDVLIPRIENVNFNSQSVSVHFQNIIREFESVNMPHVDSDFYFNSAYFFLNQPAWHRRCYRNNVEYNRFLRSLSPVSTNNE